MQKIPKKLGEILIEQGLVTEEQLVAALGVQKKEKKPLGLILVKENYVEKEKLESALARQYGSRLGEILINAKLINFEQLQHVLNIQNAEARPLGDILMELGYVTQDDLIEAQSKQYNLERINLGQYDINPEAFSKISADILKRHHVIPLNIKDGALIVATSDPEDVLAVSDLSFISGMHIQLVLATRLEIDSFLD